MKTGAPMIAVTMPGGISIGATVRASVSIASMKAACFGFAASRVRSKASSVCESGHVTPNAVAV